MYQGKAHGQERNEIGANQLLLVCARPRRKDHWIRFQNQLWRPQGRLKKNPNEQEVGLQSGRMVNARNERHCGGWRHEASQP